MNANLPLKNVTVLDLSHVYAGPYATHLMAMAGARVIKVEPPGGEHQRKRGTIPGPRYAFSMLNSNKESICLDLKHPRGSETFVELAKHADVVVENFTPGVMNRLGIGFERLAEVNNRLVFASASGYGSSGPFADYPAMDLSVQAMAGVVEGTGFPDGAPVKAGIAVVDFAAGVHLYGAIATALFEREQTGSGQQVEVSMFESIYPMLMSSLSDYFAYGKERKRTGNRHPGQSVAPYTLFEAKDGYIAIICESDSHWSKLANIMGKPDLAHDEEFSSTKSRVKNIDEVERLIASWCVNLPRDEIFQLLRSNGIPSAPTRRLSEVANDPHLTKRGFLEKIDHPRLGAITAMRSAMHYSGSNGPELAPNHELGEDQKNVFQELLHWSEEKFNKAQSDGLFG